MTHSYVGVDPGAEGCIVVIWGDNVVWHYPIDNSFTTLHYAFREMETKLPPHRVLLETPLIIRKQGTGGQATKQRAYGVMWGLLMGMGTAGIREVHPATWRAYYKFPKKSDKTLHRDKALALYPSSTSLIKSAGEGFVDALLIAHFAKQEWESRYSKGHRS